jgi:hypothetical protein
MNQSTHNTTHYSRSGALLAEMTFSASELLRRRKPYA